MEKEIIALVGAGKGGKAILETLVDVQGVEIRYVYDTNPDAPGMQYARSKGIMCLTDENYAQLTTDDEVNLVFEVTGSPEVYKTLRLAVNPKGVIIGATGTRIIFHLLESQHNITRKLENLTEKLEDKIIERTEEIETANTKLEDKIIEYGTLNDKLQQAIVDKTKYLLQATHQLKAPFAAIQSYVDIILDGYAGKITNQTQNIMDKIKARCDMLTTSIKEMLELANLQTCREENIRVEDVNINNVIQDTIKQFDVIAKKRNMKVSLKPFEKDLTVKCSADHTKTLLSILLDNAINYSHDNSNIEIETAIRNNVPTISVVDYGIGIAEEKVGKVFNEYFRTNAAADKHSNGSGLGLSIAKQIAEINGYKLEIESKVGQGTKFSVIMEDTVITNDPNHL